jgi:adenosylcobinamide-GDP ribazoletransferase
MKNAVSLFWTAVMYYTRLPVPKQVNFSDEKLRQATLLLPFIGSLVAVGGWLITWAGSLLLPYSVAVLLGLSTTILLTGGLHEDGLADTLDGLGGGKSPEERLRLMKDSHLGAFGVMGLVLVLLLKYVTVVHVPMERFFYVFWTVQVISRFQPVLMVHFNQYVRKTPDSKAGALAGGLSLIEVLISLIFAIIPFFFLPLSIGLVLLAVEGIGYGWFQWFIRRRLGGYTGDVLGALQQLSEVVGYLFLVAMGPLW